MNSYRYIEISKMTPTIGAVISGVDLNAVKNPAVYEEIRNALWENKVIFFRNQPLTPQGHIALGQAFGAMEKHEFFPHVEGFPEIQIIANSGKKSPDTDRWHADTTFRERPNGVSILRAVDLPSQGGDTMWACMNAAFEALDPPMKEMLLQLDAEHDISYAFRKMGFNEEARQLGENNPPWIHPVVVNHPVTKKLCLYVNSVWTKRFNNLTDRYGENLLRLLVEWVMKPEFQIRFRWEKDSIAIWDNIATQHYAVFDYAGQGRHMNRVTCAPTPIRLNARPNASRPAPVTYYAQLAMMSAMRPNLSSPMASTASNNAGSVRSAPAILDPVRMASLSDTERTAVQTVFDAIATLDLDQIARHASRT